MNRPEVVVACTPGNHRAAAIREEKSIFKLRNGKSEAAATTPAAHGIGQRNPGLSNLRRIETCPDSVGRIRQQGSTTGEDDRPGNILFIKYLEINKGKWRPQVDFQGGYLEGIQLTFSSRSSKRPFVSGFSTG